MTPGTRYPHAPITEAVIDIQCIGAATIAGLEQLSADELGYTQGEKLMAARGQMVFAPDSEPITVASTEPLGFLFRRQASSGAGATD